MTEKKNLFYINIAKFLAIFFVTGYHIWRIVGRPTLLIYNFDLLRFFKYGAFGVELFILISGYLSIKTWNSLTNSKVGGTYKAIICNKN